MDQLVEDPLYNVSMVNYGKYYYTEDDDVIFPKDSEYHRKKVAEFESYGGIFVNELTSSSLMAEEVAKHISTFGPELPEEYTIIKATSLEQLPADFGKIYPSSTADYDKDGLKDSEEINFELIGYDGRYYKLPTFGECKEKLGEELFYVESGLSRFGEDYAFMYMPNLEAKINETVVLPIKSDPTSEDGDGDGLLDAKERSMHGKVVVPRDYEPLKHNGPENIDQFWQKQIDMENSYNYQTDYGDETQLEKNFEKFFKFINFGEHKKGWWSFLCGVNKLDVMYPDKSDF